MKIKQLSRTRRITVIAMFSAIAYALTFVGRFSIFPGFEFLKYDPKDVIIAFGGLSVGPLAAAVISVISSLLEMVTASATGFIGFVMNVLSSCAFAVPAALIYKRRRTVTGAVVGLLTGSLAMAAVMVLWNYLITPLYMGVPRDVIAGYLIPVFLPFNLLKAGINSGLTFLLYKPLVRVLRRGGLVASPDEKTKHSFTPFIPIAAALVAACALLILSIKGII
ncbi:MAG: ECF transporter S component [Clostridia bacterium]|nr:ECF transporter S component [Clostridia bacterium]